MLRSYQTVLRGDRVDWVGTAPEPAERDSGVPVFVTLLEHSPSENAATERGRRMAAALERLAALQAEPTVPNPAARAVLLGALGLLGMSLMILVTGVLYHFSQ